MMGRIFWKIFLIHSGLVIAFSLLFLTGLPYWLVTALFFIFSFFVWLAVTRTMTISLKKMAKLLTCFGDGSPLQKVKIYSNDEIGKLVTALNETSHQLKEKIGALTAERDKIQTTLSSIIEGIVAINEEGRIALFNPAAGKMLNFGSDRAIGRLYWEVIRSSSLNIFIKEALGKEELLSKEITILLPQERIFDVTIIPPAGGARGAVVALHDITEIRRLERMRIEFVASVSHELRTPLTAIKGFVETLKMGAANDPSRRQQFLGIIERNAQRLSNLIDDLFTISHIESGEVKLEFQSLNIGELIEEMADSFEKKIEEKRHRNILNIPSHLPAVRADRKRIEQVLSNLLDNAIKFTPPGGEISLAATLEEEHVRVEVSDNGIGIPQKHLGRLFERFYRAEEARSRELGGTGLGLSIVKHIIQAHGGEVGVESEGKKGSKFFFTLHKAEKE